MSPTNTTLIKACGALSLIASCKCYAADVDKPHIILIMTDQQRGDAMGCAGNRAVLTPNMDKLAEDGNLFTNAYTSLPSSTPARASLLTGMSPWNHGMLGYTNQAERYPYEKPRILNDLGYITMGIGKMHWNPQNNNRGMQNVLYDESGRRENEYFTSDYRKWFATQALGLNPDSTGIGWNDHRSGAYSLPEHLHPTAWTGEMAKNTIANYCSDQPLYLKVSFARPHSPYDPPQRLVDKLKAEAAEPAAPFKGEWVPQEWIEKTDPLASREAAIGNFGDEYTSKSRLYYNAAITFIDEQIGEIITELKRKGMYDNSIIIFISDHGDMLGDHCRWRKTYAYEGSTAIPFIVKLPEGYSTHIKAGQTIEQPVELRDILPTLMDINNLDRPEMMDGLSLLEIYNNKNPQWRKYIDLEHAGGKEFWTALTDGKIKYIRFNRDGREQLFDLVNDPGEEHDLSQDKKWSKKLIEIRSAMADHLAIRGSAWVKDGVIQNHDNSIVKGDNFPKADQ